MDALITYGSNRISYSALRSLASLGLNVAAVDAGRVGMCQWSRFCRRSYTCADPLKHTEAFINDIIRILKESGARFLLPGLHDTEILAKYRDRLPESVILPVADYKKIRMANDKDIMAAYAKELGIGVPEVIEWKNWDELEEGLRAMDGRVVVKLRNGFGAKWVFYPSTHREAASICKSLVGKFSLGPDQLPIVQKWVEGEKWGVACLYHEGKMLASFTQKMLRQKPSTGGASTLRVSARNAKTEEYSGRLLDGLAWHGIAMLEFIYNPGSGEAWFIEVNPRLWSSIELAVASGVDLVALLYIASTEGPEKALDVVRTQRDGVLCRWWMGDAMLAVSEAKRRRPLKALKLIWPGGTDVYDEFKGNDPAATAGSFASLLADLLGNA